MLSMYVCVYVRVYDVCVCMYVRYFTSIISVEEYKLLWSMGTTLPLTFTFFS